MRERSAAGGIFRVIGRILLILLVTILLFAVFLLGVMGVLIHGPSAEAERLFVLSVNETSALKFLPHIYLSDAQVDAILHPVSTSTDDEPAPDDNFVELPYEDGRTVEDENTNAGQVVVADPSENTGESGEWLEVVDIKGSTFKGKLMIIRDPSKVVVGTLDAYGANYHGLYLYEFIDKYNAIGGTNAGGFYDPGGGGNGGGRGKARPCDPESSGHDPLAGSDQPRYAHRRSPAVLRNVRSVFLNERSVTLGQELSADRNIIVVQRREAQLNTEKSGCTSQACIRFCIAK